MLTSEIQTPATKPNTVSLPPEAWQAHFQAWEKSGLNKTEYCRAQGLTIDSFRYWYKQLVGTPEVTSKPADFIKVVSPKKPVSTSMSVELRFPNQVAMKFTLTENQLLDFIRKLGDATAIIR